MGDAPRRFFIVRCGLPLHVEAGKQRLLACVPMLVGDGSGSFEMGQGL